MIICAPEFRPSNCPHTVLPMHNIHIGESMSIIAHKHVWSLAIGRDMSMHASCGLVNHSKAHESKSSSLCFLTKALDEVTFARHRASTMNARV